jgi:hypothetical protein
MGTIANAIVYLIFILTPTIGAIYIKRCTQRLIVVIEREQGEFVASIF